MSRSYKITPKDLARRGGWCNCPRCHNGRMHKHKKKELSAKEQIKDQQAA